MVATLQTKKRRARLLLTQAANIKREKTNCYHRAREYKERIKESCENNGKHTPYMCAYRQRKLWLKPTTRKLCRGGEAKYVVQQIDFRYGGRSSVFVKLMPHLRIPSLSAPGNRPRLVGWVEGDDSLRKTTHKHHTRPAQKTQTRLQVANKREQKINSSSASVGLVLF